MDERFFEKGNYIDGTEMIPESIDFTDFKTEILNSWETKRFPLMVTQIPHESIFTSISSLDQGKISNILIKNEFTIPVVGRFVVIEKTGQVRIVIHDGHHSSIVNYVRNGRRKFDILVVEGCPFPGNMSLKKLADRAGSDLLSL